MKLFISIFITLFAVFLFQPICYANPIPVFWLFGWIDADTSDIYEYNGRTTDFNKCVKSYDMSGSTIYEYNGCTTDFNKCVKSYDMSGSTIYEYNGRTTDFNKCVKSYHF